MLHTPFYYFYFYPISVAVFITAHTNQRHTYISIQAWNQRKYSSWTHAVKIAHTYHRKEKSHVLFNVESCCHFQACLSISARENEGMCKYVCGVGTHRYSTMFMTSSARLPWLTALVLLQSQLETPQRKRLSCNEPPRRMQLINSVYFWTKFVCTRRGLCLYMCILSMYLLS